MRKFDGLYFKVLPSLTLIYTAYWGMDLFENLKINNLDRVKLDIFFFVVFLLGFMLSIYGTFVKKD